MKPYLVLDTNILLLDANNLLTLGQDNIIVLPETVLDEIDNKKSGHLEISYQAREFGRLLTRATVEDIANKSGIGTITYMLLDGVEIEVVSLSEYPNAVDVEPHIRNDRKILEVASFYDTHFPNVVFMTNDVMCKMRAISLGLRAIDLKTVDYSEHTFTKTIEIPTDVFSKLHNLPIIEVDLEYSPENYNYMFQDALTGQKKLGNIRNGFIDILGKDTETDLRKQDVTPVNAGQLFLSRAILNPTTEIVVCEALAGSGKTVSAFSNAIRLVKKGFYGGITYIRASVDDVDRAEEIGFLSGNDEKMEVYLHPVQDTLDFIVRNKHKDSKLKGKDFEEFVDKAIDEMKLKFDIQAMIGLGMRGRTFSNRVVIIDEAQNMSKSSMQKVLTRFGKNCKIIIIGSNKQIDNQYITKYTNCLSVLLDACTKEQDLVKLHAVSLSRVVRSNIAEFAEHAFSKVKS